MSLDRPWLQSYPKGVPAEIDVNEFHSVASVFDASVAKFRDRPAYSSFGKVLTDSEINVMDNAAISLAMDNNLPIVVFDLLTHGNIRRVVEGQGIGTKVS